MKIKTLKMANRLTLQYFSILAVLLIATHVMVYYSTFEAMERALAQEQFNEVRPLIVKQLENTTQTQLQISPHIFVYTTKSAFPDYFTPSPIVRYDEVYEVHVKQPGFQEYFYQRTRMMVNDKQQDVWLANYKDVHQFDREELFFSLRFQLLATIIILLVSLFFAQRISTHLTQPITVLAAKLKHRSPENHKPINLDTNSEEASLLLNSINNYQQTISQLLERERAFSQHVSHELRTPLMVIKGAISLLRETGGDAFAEKQYQRLHQASEEMNAFITTLLNLNRDPVSSSSAFSRSSFEEVIEQYEHLVEGKALSWELHCETQTQLPGPEPIIKILLGNLVKNAFNYTESGTVDIRISKQQLSVTDTGPGLEKTENSDQGYGLGLVIVKSICRQYNWKFTLSEQATLGCVAQISFS